MTDGWVSEMDRWMDEGWNKVKGEEMEEERGGGRNICGVSYLLTFSFPKENEQGNHDRAHKIPSCPISVHHAHTPLPALSSSYKYLRAAVAFTEYLDFLPENKHG